MDVGGEDAQGYSENARGFSAHALLPGFRFRDNSGLSDQFAYLHPQF